jgi:hypothetical protein
MAGRAPQAVGRHRTPPVPIRHLPRVRLQYISVTPRTYAGFCLALLLAITLWLLAPSLRSANVALPVPARTHAIPVNTVPLLNSWTIWWNANSLGRGLAGYWNAPIFHPEPGTFAFSEPQPATLLLAPLVWWNDSPFLAYHCYLLVNLLLNGLVTLFVLRRLRVNRLVSLAAGVAVLLLPLVWEQLDTVQLVPLWPAVWIWYGLIKLTETRVATPGPAFSLQVLLRKTIATAIGLAIGCSMQAALCVHHLLMIAWLAVPATICLVVGRPLKIVSIRLAIAGGLALLLLLPMLQPMRRIHAERRFERSEQTQQALSASATQWVKQPLRGWWNTHRDVERISEGSFNPGWLRTILAGSILLYWPYVPHRRRRVVLFLAVLLVLAICLSLGTNLRIGNLVVWGRLVDTVPLLQSVRSVYRFAFFAQLAIVLLAAISLDQLWRQWQHWTRLHGIRAPRHAIRQRKGGLRTSLSGKLVAAIWFGLVLCLAFEVPTPQLRLVGVPAVGLHREWIEHLADDPQAAPILCLPMAQGYSEAALESEARWMIFGSWHGRPLLNGYSGFFPERWFDYTSRFSTAELMPEDVDYLLQLGVQCIVLDRTRPNCPRFASGLLNDDQPPRVYNALTTQEGIEVWRIR